MNCEQDSIDICLVQGKTFSMTFRWAAEPYVYKEITGIANTSPVRLTVVGHGMPDGWEFAVSGAEGLTSLNARRDPPRDSEYYEASVIDDDTVEINKVNGAILESYTGGGAIQYLTPVALEGMTAMLQVRDHAAGTTLLTLTSADGDITIDTINRRIELVIPASATEGVDWRSGLYELEMTSGTEVALLAYGSVTLTEEVATGV